MKNIMLSCFICLLLSSCVCSSKKTDQDDKGQGGITLPHKMDSVDRPVIKRVDDDTGRFMKAKEKFIPPPTLDTISVR